MANRRNALGYTALQGESGVVPAGSISNTELASMTRGTVKVGNSSNQASDLDAKTSGNILIGDGTDITSAAVSGDITVSGTGVTAIGAQKVTMPKLARGTNGQIIVANTSADPAYVSVSGDATLAANGALTVANNAVTYAKIQNTAATGVLIGRKTAGAGNVEEITPAGDLTLSGSTFTVASTIAKRLDFQTSEVTITNSTTPTVIFTGTVTGGSLSTGNMIVGEVWYSYVNNSGGNATFTATLTYGSTAIVAVPTGNIGTSVATRSGKITFMIKASGATNSQYGQLDITQAQISNFGLASTATEDSTADKTLSITITMGSNTATQTFVGRAYLPRLVKV